MGNVGGFATNRDVTTIRDLIVMSTLRPGPQDAECIKDDYEMQMSDVVDESSMYRLLRRLMKKKLVMYASSSVLQKTELDSGRKYFALTRLGEAEVEKVFDALFHNEKMAINKEKNGG